MKPLSESHQRAIERARQERNAPLFDKQGRRVRVRTRVNEKPAGQDEINACRHEDPLGMVQAARKAYVALADAGLLNGFTRSLLTRDYQDAITAVHRAGLRSELRNATWPPDLSDEPPQD
jgi:hypothetical protein